MAGRSGPNKWVDGLGVYSLWHGVYMDLGASDWCLA